MAANDSTLSMAFFLPIDERFFIVLMRLVGPYRFFIFLGTLDDIAREVNRARVYPACFLYISRKRTPIKRRYHLCSHCLYEAR